MLNVCDKTIAFSCFHDILYWNGYPCSLLVQFCHQEVPHSTPSLLPRSFLRVKLEKGGFFHYWAPVCSFLPYDRLWSPRFSEWVNLSERNKVSPCTSQLIHVPWSIPSQLRSFQVNGVLIAPVHGFWKRGLLWWSTTIERSCLSDNIKAVIPIFHSVSSLSVLPCISVLNCVLPLSLNELCRAMGVAATWRCSKGVAQSHRLNETADTLLDHSYSVPSINVLCTQVSVSYVSAAAHHTHSLLHIQHNVEGHCICLHWHLTLSVSSAPLAISFSLSLSCFSLFVFWSRTGCITSGRGRQSLRDLGALAVSKCVGARETCCLATTAPLSSGCDGDVLHIAYARTRVCVYVCVWVLGFFMCVSPQTVNVCTCMTACFFFYVRTCLCTLMYLCVFVVENECWKEGQEGAPPSTQQAFRPHGWLPKTPLVISSTSIHLF